ncbi:MAG: ROK family transcriptional regulator [Sphaerochaetaceae bacterium]|nr:ROK family transcriptional regulator [Sphaerochaetaceae bacterium]NLO60497.1 ROK family transcriptional regulator [Spirochaetales bacterium]MDD2406390.1 ROK family transcriptional regulator [Sphaerochaetaceae bacterium]MDD3670280.1 ROK family transcriptional regulator [Sphaerochaetaceae bacterium]MDD4258705.1 ROK family transcriptional regulator [Sphaerochaetaceae bacterium]
MTIGDNGFIKELNYKTVLDTIRTKGAVSRADVSRLTGLTRSTCTVICDRMLKQGIIIETGTVGSTGGRPPILLQINNRAGAVLGLKMMEDMIAGATVDLGGNIIQQQSWEMRPGLDMETYLPRFEEFVQDIIGKHRNSYPLIPMLGIGIGVGGRVSSDGVLIKSSVLGWRDVSLKKRLQKRFSMPVHIENDVNTFAIGEKFFGAGVHYENFLSLSVGEGIGLGIIIDGKLFAGSHHGAGELGHTRISFDSQAPYCTCGKQGCLESFTSDRAIIGMYNQETGKTFQINEIIQKASEGDPHALKVFKIMGRYLGIAVSSLVNIFDPQAVIIGGERTNASQFFIKELSTAMQENTVYDLAKDVDLIVLEPSNNEWIRGVAALAIREFFSATTNWRQ